MSQLSLIQIFALNAMAACIELVYAVEGAYFVPAIYDSGVSQIYGSMLICISPLMGTVFQSYLGTASDQCQCTWGRRRPFILGLTITCLIGLLLFPFTNDISDLIDKPNLRKIVLIVLVVTATFFSDFSAGSLQVPVRAYLLDVVPQSQTKLGNIAYSMCVGIGGITGFGIGAVKWSSIFTPSNDFSFQVMFVCITASCLVILCAILNACSAREQVSYEILRDSDDNHPSQIQTNTTIYNNMPSDKATSLENCDSHIKNKAKNCICFGNLLNSIKGNFVFMRYMSPSLVILCVAYFFSLVGLYTQLYFFTSYMAEVIYDGDVNAPHNSTAYKDYTDGITFGSLALGISAVTGLVISLLLGPLMKLFGMRLVLVGSYVVLMLESGVLIVTHSAIVTILLAPAVYISLIIIFAIPFILASMYEDKGLLLRTTWPYSDTNLTGRTCAILGIACFVAQAFALLINGPLIHLYGSVVSVMIVTCVTSFLGALVACFVTIPANDESSQAIKEQES
ncbi:membrane-associated transporter protein-like [Dysidea avara]|uniref:membrane-associated transporter protein-like n=1 Tax=Dysidea avara TaxID=196820 RepID=UPI003323515A